MVHISAQLSLIFEFFDKILFLKTIENHFLKIIFKNLLLRMVFWNIAKESLKFLSLVLYQMVRQLEILTQVVWFMRFVTFQKHSNNGYLMYFLTRAFLEFRLMIMEMGV